MMVLLSGNEAIARGAIEAGVRVAAGYPGTPSTEILEALARAGGGAYVQWSTNEKVALDVALGAAMGGVRAMATMKHVGLNVAADTFMTAAYTGVRGGLVVVSADDPGLHSSQNEQDNRLYARFAGVPLLEPADSREARDFTVLAFDLSEEFDTPVLLRTTTRIAHCRGVVTPGPVREGGPRGFERDPRKYVMLPAFARDRHAVLLRRLAALAEYAETSPVNVEEMGDPAVGIITGGIAYQYVRDVLPDASVFKLGLTHPLPLRRLREFAARVGRLIVVEELEPFLEERIRAAGVAVEGKEFFPRTGELTPDLVRAGLARAGVIPESRSRAAAREPAMPRPPVLCPGCPHVVPYLVLRSIGAVVAGDIGCYTLAAMAPLSAMDSCVAMGCSIGMALGLARAGTAPGPVVATIGDSTFLHAGIPGLIDAVYIRTPVTVLILDNGTTAMTGGQPHPGTGVTLQGTETRAVDLARLCGALGVDHVQVVDPYDVGATSQARCAATAHRGVSVVITNRPCVEAPVKIRDAPFRVIEDACTACQACMNLGCPAIAWTDGWYEGRRRVAIDGPACTGCTVCAQICPTQAIVPIAEAPGPRAHGAAPAEVAHE
ncbi:MAG: indolepyruvate ferredoxin oxidoreductase subunit alpha [Armatimonadetes bacterium]|nr:indolepyruvate ferredoxin oxidoreductase subunit alpha [Armatimonadota bacterium]